VRASRDPADMLREFFDGAYDAAADLAGWEREKLERLPIAP
jgi:hypothetical protein